jgi:hypothetical protein
MLGTFQDVLGSRQRPTQLVTWSVANEPRCVPIAAAGLAIDGAPPRTSATPRPGRVPGRPTVEFLVRIVAPSLPRHTKNGLGQRTLARSRGWSPGASRRRTHDGRTSCRDLPRRRRPDSGGTPLRQVVNSSNGHGQVPTSQGRRHDSHCHHQQARVAQWPFVPTQVRGADPEPRVDALAAGHPDSAVSLGPHRQVDAT